MDSVLQERKVCWFGGSACGKCLQSHHIFGGPNRMKSEKYGLKVWLCVKHHTGSNLAVHVDHQRSLKLKQYAQRYFEENIGSRELFIKEFGKNYLDLKEDDENED